TALGVGIEANAEARLLVDYADIQLNAFIPDGAHSYGALSNILFSLGAAISYVADGVFDRFGLNLGFDAAARLTRLATYDGFGAEININAHIGGSQDHLNGVDVEANANAHRTTTDGFVSADAAAHALASATIAGESINISGPVKVLANAHGGSSYGEGFE